MNPSQNQSLFYTWSGTVRLLREETGALCQHYGDCSQPTILWSRGEPYIVQYIHVQKFLFVEKYLNLGFAGCANGTSGRKRGELQEERGDFDSSGDFLINLFSLEYLLGPNLKVVIF